MCSSDLLVLLAIKLITGELALARRWALGAWPMAMRYLMSDGRRNVRVRDGQTQSQETRGPW